MSSILFGVAVVILLAALAGAVWSAAVPERRLWPPPGRGSWPYVLNWTGFCVVCAINVMLLLWITHLLLALVFLVAPLAEEPWLEEQYGEEYREHMKRVRRFL